MVTLKLKIKEKGLVIEIPGLPPTRTPADINISNVDLNLVIAHLRKNGISNYEIVSVIGDGTEQVVSIPQDLKKKVKEKYPSDPSVDKRFDRLESMMIDLLKQKRESKTNPNQEQITNKLDNLEKLIERQKYAVVPSTDSDEPKIEELDERFIPEIDVEGMSLKGDTGKIDLERDESADEAADLLSSIRKEEK